jgi:solute carrier family 35 protein F5
MNRPSSLDNSGLLTRSLSPASRASSLINSLRDDLSSKKRWRHSRWRHTLGILLLLCTVCLWTTSNFLASTIFADDTYSKPFFVTYVNSMFFILPLIPLVIRKLYEDPSELASLKELVPGGVAMGRSSYHGYEVVKDNEDEHEHDALEGRSEERGIFLREGSPAESMMLDDDPIGASVLIDDAPSERLNLLDTAKLSLEFAFLWFAANYFMAACLEYTTVSSSTILTSTSSIWTLLVGSLWGVERFTVRKLLGVLASLAGIVLISMMDLSGQSDKNRGSFPHKSIGEMAIGNAMAFFSAVLYGIYAVVMKKRIGDEGRVNMPLFFGLVGLFDVVLLWPGFVILHLLGIETWELPPQGKVLTIILVRSL